MDQDRTTDSDLTERTVSAPNADEGVQKTAEAEAVSAEKTPEDIEKEYQGKMKELDDRYLRLAAEFDNYKKRTVRQFEDIIRGANEELIIRVLEIVDDFDRARAAGEQAADCKSLQSGMELIYQHLDEIMKKEGVERIISLGKKFDPDYHDAMMQIESEEYPSGTVAMEMAAGYKLKGKVIRHARVAVSRGRATADEKNEA